IAKVFSYPMLWLAFLLSSVTLFQNPDDKNMIKKKGLLWRRNFGIINGSGVNINKFKVKKLEENPTFLIVSRLTGSKGVNEFVEAATKVKKLYPDSTFNLVGPLDDEDSSLDMIKLNKAVQNEYVNFIGEVEDVRPYIEQS